VDNEAWSSSSGKSSCVLERRIDREIERDVQTERQREKNRETGRPGGGLESCLEKRPDERPGERLGAGGPVLVGRAADNVSERFGGAAWTAASPRGGARRVRDGRLLRTVEPDVVTLQDLFNSAVHEWTAEVDRQRDRETERQRVTETEVDEAVFLLGWGRG